MIRLQVTDRYFACLREFCEDIFQDGLFAMYPLQHVIERTWVDAMLIPDLFSATDICLCQHDAGVQL